MNKERLLQVADAIEREEIAKFDMGTWYSRPSDAFKAEYPKCETTGCVAGFAMLMFGDGDYSSMHQFPAKLLEVPEDVAYELFYAGSVATDDDSGFTVISANRDYTQAVPEALRWMVANDTINWRDALTAIGAIK